MKITARINTIPKGQARPRSRAIRLGNGKITAQAYKCKDQRQCEETLSALLMPFQPERPLEGQLRLTLNIFMPIPTSKPKRWRAEALDGKIRPLSRPDVSNVVKNLEDVMQAMSWFGDDKQIVTIVARKFYADVPGYYLELEEV